MYYGVVNGKKIGVFNNFEYVDKYVKGFSGAQFKKFAIKEDAEEYFAKGVISKFTNEKNRNLKIKVISSLSDELKNIIFKYMTKIEIREFRELAADLMEKRITAVLKHKVLLDYLTESPIKVMYSILLKNYSNIDLSMAVYSMKAIINVMGQSDFSKDDGSSSYNKNSTEYYNICMNYWDKIWWDTDTGKLSKEQIENKQFTEYHLKCNKIITIAEIRKYMHKFNNNDFNERWNVKSLVKENEIQKNKKAAGEEQRRLAEEERIIQEKHRKAQEQQSVEKKIKRKLFLAEKKAKEEEAKIERENEIKILEKKRQEDLSAKFIMNENVKKYADNSLFMDIAKRYDYNIYDIEYITMEWVINGGYTYYLELGASNEYLIIRLEELIKLNGMGKITSIAKMKKLYILLTGRCYLKY